MLKNEIGERLRMIIGNQSKKDFAGSFNVTPQLLNNWLSGLNFPAIDFLAELSRRGINLNWLFTGLGPVYHRSNDQDGIGIPAEAQIFIKQLLEAGMRPEKLPELSKDLKKLAELRHDIETKQIEMSEAWQDLKQSFKRKKRER
jgi:transcriptional regulator with XRE-family HTH domain